VQPNDAAADAVMLEKEALGLVHDGSSSALRSAVLTC
jgi:hypothetical protein